MSNFNAEQAHGVVADIVHNHQGVGSDGEPAFTRQENLTYGTETPSPAEDKPPSVEIQHCHTANDEVIELGGEFDYEGYQVVRREFFAHINEPSVTFNNYKVYVNAACLNRFPTVDYVQVLVNQDNRILALRPCREEERDAFRWCTSGSGRRKPRQITCRLFFAKVFSLMGWNPDYRYKLLGKVIHANDEYLVAFDLSATEVYQRVFEDGEKPKTSRVPVFPEGWQNQFGLPFEEHRKSMQIDIFEGYAVYGIKDNTASVVAANPKDEANNLPDILIHYDIPGGSGI